MAKAKNCVGLIVALKAHCLNLGDMGSVSLSRLLHPQAMLSVCFLAWGVRIRTLVTVNTLILGTDVQSFSYQMHCRNWPKVKAGEARESKMLRNTRSCPSFA